jgi:hypothetical protein
MGQKRIWNGDRFLFTFASRRAIRQDRQQINRSEGFGPKGNLEQRQVSIYLGALSRIFRQAREQISRSGRKRLWAKRHSGTETSFYSIYLGILPCCETEKEKSMGQKAIWNGDYFLFTLAPRRALRQSRQQTTTRTSRKRQTLDMDQKAICNGDSGSHQNSVVGG